MKRALRLYKNSVLFTPSNGQSALEVAKSSLSQMTLGDGELLVARYQETGGNVKTVMAVAHDISQDTGITFFADNTELIQNLDKTPYVEVSSVSSPQTIDPYKLYDLGTVSSAVTIAFNTQLEVSGYAKEYALRFVAGSGCAITLPSGVLYSNGTTPTYVAGHTYEIDIINNCAVVGEFY